MTGAAAGTAVALAVVALAVVAVTAVTLAAAGVRRRWLVVRVCGDSMLPTLRDGETVLVRRCRGDALRVGDVVVCGWPVPAGTAVESTTDGSRAPGQVIKRVAAVAGDRMPVGLAGACAGMPTVPAGTVVVLSDGVGADSRAFGPVPHELVHGVFVRRMAPA